MPATLLAVDDSVTMRKVLEMTFAGEDFRVVTAASADDALVKVKSEKPSLVLSDITLAGKTGYDLCAAIKRDNPTLPVVLLSSKLNPYDKGRGQSVRADDYIDKPFDTQKLLDKVNGLLSGEKKPAAVQGAPKAAPKPYRAPASLGATLVGQGVPTRPQVSKSPTAASHADARQAPPTNLRATADFAARPIGRSVSARAPSPPATTAAASPPPAAAKPGPAVSPTRPVRTSQASRTAPATTPKPSPVAVPKPAHTATPKPAAVVASKSSPATTPKPAPVAAHPHRAPTTATKAATEITATGDDFSAKLTNLGLSKEQVEGVLALSNEVVERVVWEVVPVLAETIIKEELKRLTEES